MRDRLIEFINYSRDFRKTCSKWGSNEPCKGCKYDLGAECDLNGRIADHLLANGVIVPPVSIGGTVYTIRGKKLLKKWKVLFIGINSLGEIKLNIADKGFKNVLEVWDCNFGKNVFLTIEDAEKAISEREGKG